MFEIVARELRAKLLGRQRGLADTTQQHSTAGVEGAGGAGGPGCGARGRRRGQAGLRGDTPSHAQRHSAAGVEGAGGIGGPGCGARARQSQRAHAPQAPPDWRPPRGLRGLAGLRDDAPSEARGADGERAGRPRGGRRSGEARNTSGATSTTGAQANRPYSPPPGSGRPV